MAIKLNWQSAKFQKWAAFVAVFSLSLIFFLFLTFPYEIFKETLSNNIKRETGLDISIGEMGMSLPLGIKLTDVNMTKPGVSRNLKFETIRINLGILPFILGKIGIYVNIDKLNGKKEVGEFDLVLKAGIISSMMKRNLTLSSVSLKANKFELDEISDLALGMLAQKRDMNPLLLPVIEAVQLKASMQGSVDLSMSGASPSGATGTIDLSLQQAVLEMRDKTIPKQTFSKALFKADIKNGLISFDKNAGMTANDFAVGVGGKIGLKDNVAMSTLDLTLEIKIDGELKESYGFLLDNLAGGDGNGETRLTLQGTFAQPIKVFGSSSL